MENSLELTSSQEKQEKSYERVLTAIGISEEDLDGKVILDLGAGGRWLEKGVRMHRVNAHVTSFDRRFNEVSDDMYGKTLTGDFDDGLMLEDEQFDLVIDVGGPLRGGPYTERGVREYLEALRVLKSGGQLRITAAMIGEGVADILYQAYRDGNFPIDNQTITQYVNSAQEEIHLDPDGTPSIIDDFWRNRYNTLSVDQQKELRELVAEDMKSVLFERGVDISYEFGESTNPKMYNPPLIITKQ